MKKLRTKTFGYSPTERGQRIFDRLSSFVIKELHVDDVEKTKFLFKLEGRPCCKLVWQIAHGYSNHHMKIASARLLQGKETLRTPNRSRKKKHRVNLSGSAEIEAKGWLRALAESVGDRMPTFDHIRLPFATKKDVYLEYCEDLRRRKGESRSPIHVDTFCKLWRKDRSLAKIILTPTDSGFPECVLCGNFRRRLSNPEASNEERDRAKSERKAHMDLQTGERETYSLHREMSHREPSKYCCIIIDGMTLDTTSVPHPAREDKTTECVPLKRRLVHRLSGVKLHHNGETKHYAFMFPPWVGHGGSNMVCEVICSMADVLGDQRPGHLFLQVDNCSENKSKTVLALADKLVKDHIFQTVQINYLVVGHTHEDIDQWFSVFSKAIRKDDIWTAAQLFDLLRGVSENDEINPELVYCTSRHAFAAWLEPNIDKQLGGYCRDPSPHEFIFTTIQGQVLMRYKPWSRSERYQPTECNGISVLTSDLSWSSLQYDSFDFKFDEDEACQNNVGMVIQHLCQKPGIKEEWTKYWSEMPKQVEDVESKWSIQSLRPRPVQVALSAGPDVPTAEQVYRDSRVLVSHAGLRRNDRDRILRDISTEQRLRLEAEHVKTLVPLAKDTFVVFIVDSDFWEQPGFTAAERNLRICIGKTVEPVECINPEFTTQVLLFRCASGNPNKAWTPAIKTGTRTAQRVIGIPRGSIFYHSSNLFTTSRTLLAKAKKDLASYYLSPYEVPAKSSALELRKADA